MSTAKGLRWAIAGLAAGAVLALAACAPIPKTVDTPKNGDSFTLALKQPMQVRWGNQRPDQGDWVLESASGPTVTLAARKVQPPGEGAQQVEIFDFVAAQKGAQDLTFTYRHKDGQPPTADERVTIAVTVG